MCSYVGGFVKCTVNVREFSHRLGCHLTCHHDGIGIWLEIGIENQDSEKPQLQRFSLQIALVLRDGYIAVI